MPKVPKFNKANAALNKEWGGVKNFGKRLTASRRRQDGERIIREELEDKEFYHAPSLQRKKKKEWVLEEYSYSGWRRKYWSSKFRHVKGVVDSVNRIKHLRGTSEFWRTIHSDSTYRARNIVTGEIVLI